MFKLMLQSWVRFAYRHNIGMRRLLYVHNADASDYYEWCLQTEGPQFWHL